MHVAQVRGNRWCRLGVVAALLEKTIIEDRKIMLETRVNFFTEKVYPAQQYQRS